MNSGITTAVSIGASVLISTLSLIRDKKIRMEIEYLKESVKQNRELSSNERKSILDSLERIKNQNDIEKNKLNELQEEYEKQHDYDTEMLREAQDRIKKENLEKINQIEEEYKIENENIIEKYQQMKTKAEIELKKLKEELEEIEKCSLTKQEKNLRQHEFKRQMLIEKQHRIAKRIDREAKNLIEEQKKIETEQCAQKEANAKQFENDILILRKREELIKKRLEIDLKHLEEMQEELIKKEEIRRRSLFERLNRYERYNEIEEKITTDIAELIFIQSDSGKPESVTYNIDCDISGKDSEDCLRLLSALPSGSTSSIPPIPVSIQNSLLKLKSQNITRAEISLDDSQKIEYKENDDVSLEENFEKLTESERKNLEDEITKALEKCGIDETNADNSVALTITTKIMKKFIKDLKINSNYNTC
ncbi:caldesmon-like isoform X2 [Condylostylus longicornis]|uniref:caldesmon-like isoform X2 n=1 Tax=Condylostylus longicornis TaxID=2530218 RepID=UPI00244E4729|nr:caldesmon-like isoform X2 [Condylostylus longicornis]